MERHFLVFILAVNLSLLISCEKESDNIKVEIIADNENNIDSTTNTKDDNYTQDPVGTQTLILPDGGTPFSLGSGIYNTNYVSYNSNRIGGVYCLITDMGEFGSLGAVRWTNPYVWNQWAVAQISHGYAIKFTDYWDETIYARAFITKAIVGVDGTVGGIEINYEFDWQDPLNTTLELKTEDSYWCKTRGYRVIRVPFANPTIIKKIQYDSNDNYIAKIEATRHAIYVCLYDINIQSNWDTNISVSNSVNTQIFNMKSVSAKYTDFNLPF